MQEHHSNAFYFLRLMAALLVAYGVAITRAAGAAYSPFTESNSQLGIHMLFIIGGYLSVASYERHQHLLNYLRNRFLRAFPAVLSVVVFTVLVMGVFTTSLSSGAYLGDPKTLHYLRSLTLLYPQPTLPGVAADPVNPLLWVVPQGLFAVLLIASLGVLGILQPRIVAFLTIGFAALSAYSYSQSTGGAITLSELRLTSLRISPHLLFLFLCGATIQLNRHAIPRHIGLLCAAILLMILSLKLGSLWGRLLNDVALAYAIIYIGHTTIPLLSHWARFGDLSYGVLLFACPAQLLLRHFTVMAKISPMLHAVSGISFTILLAFLSWHCLEKRALSFKA